uniref:Armadillo repeat-containing protein 6 n=1 Tax=Mesocestoides corti TaxID=53468 RepID=A0A5K3FIM9_MESCO
MAIFPDTTDRIWKNCRQIAWACTMFLLLFFCAVFLGAGIKFMVTYSTPSPNCTKAVTEAPLDKQLDPTCTNEARSRQFMMSSGYAMICIGVVFGLAFIAISIRLCYKGSCRNQAPQTHNEREAFARQSNRPTPNLDSIIGSPPDYETACQAPTINDDEDSMSYYPPPNEPPPLPSLPPPPFSS